MLRGHRRALHCLGTKVVHVKCDAAWFTELAATTPSAHESSSQYSHLSAVPVASEDAGAAEVDSRTGLCAPLLHTSLWLLVPAHRGVTTASLLTLECPALEGAANRSRAPPGADLNCRTATTEVPGQASLAWARLTATRCVSPPSAARMVNTLLATAQVAPRSMRSEKLCSLCSPHASHVTRTGISHQAEAGCCALPRFRHPDSLHSFPLVDSCDRTRTHLTRTSRPWAPAMRLVGSFESPKTSPSSFKRPASSPLGRSASPISPSRLAAEGQRRCGNCLGVRVTWQR